MAANQTINSAAGDSLQIVITVYDDAGDAVSLTGATVRWWLGLTPYATGDDIYVEKQTGGSGVTVDGNVATVLLVPADTETVTPGVLYHEAEVTFPDTSVSTPVRGRFNLEPALIP